jgi:hypothetical protein
MIGKGRIMRFYRSSMAIAAMTFLTVASVHPGHAFSIKQQSQVEAQSEEGGKINNSKLRHAALLEAKAYICGTDSAASEEAMRAGMKETGLPEDIAVEIVSDLASGIVDHAVKTNSKEICGKPAVRLSRL